MHDCSVHNVFQHTVFSTNVPLLQQYKERDVFQPVQWPLNTTYPIIFHQYIYFFESKENRKTFMLNPLKYLRQPKPTPALPAKIAVVGPPKSGKTTGKTPDSCKIIHRVVSFARSQTRITLFFSLTFSLTLQWHRCLLANMACLVCPLAVLCVRY